MGRCTCAGLGLALVLLAGCWGARDERPRCFPVRGELFVNGKPAVGARVALTASDDKQLARLAPHAEVGTDGTFHVTTFRTGDGAPAGRYAMTVTWPLPPRPGREEQGPDRFKGRYADPRRPLRQIEVVPGDNVLDPIQLK